MNGLGEIHGSSPWRLGSVLDSLRVQVFGDEALGTSGLGFRVRGLGFRGWGFGFREYSCAGPTWHLDCEPDAYHSDYITILMSILMSA